MRAAAEPNRTPDAPISSGAVSVPVWPRITLVTAVYNGERYLEETIRSVLEQNYPNLEYIIVNDGSRDGTVDIIKKYERHLAGWYNQSNKGLYAALNAGFSHSTGEVMGWLNASDKLHTKGLMVVGSVFSHFPQVAWITGRATGFNDDGMTVEVQPVRHWSRHRFLMGANRHIQQESTFWRRSLWEKVGGHLDESFRAEGDFDLWVRFFRHASLYPVDALIGGWRYHFDSLSHENVDRYNLGCDEIATKEMSSLKHGQWFFRYLKIDRTISQIPKIRGAWQRLFVNPLRHMLYHCPGSDWPPVIEYKGGGWRFRQK